MSENTEQTVEAVSMPAPEVPPVKLSEQDKENFIRSFLSDQPYFETFKLLGGRCTVEFKTISGQENLDLLAQVDMDRKQGRTINGDAYYTRLSFYRLALALVTIDGTPWATEITKVTKPANEDMGESYVSHKADIIQQWNETKISAIQARFNEFQRKVIVMTSEVDNENFWKAAE